MQKFEMLFAQMLINYRCEERTAYGSVMYMCDDVVEQEFNYSKYMKLLRH